MAKQKLSDKQWEIVGKRYLAGESASALGREFGVTEAAIRKRFSAKHSEIKKVANQLVAAEQAFEALPLSSKLEVRTLADKLKSISGHLAGAAELGAINSHRLATLTNTAIEKIDDVNPLGSVEELRTVAALTDLANKAAVIPLALLNANKDKMPETPDANNIRTLTDAELAEIASGS